MAKNVRHAAFALVAVLALSMSAESKRVRNAYVGPDLPAGEVATLTIDKLMHIPTAWKGGYESRL